jgi:DNA-binding response OmpR family regulator
MIRKALVVDDDPMVLCLLEYILESKDYNVTRATDGDQAIKVLETEDFDLVITDLQMGQTSGFDVIRKAKAFNYRTIVIMITGVCDPSKEAEAFHHGADDYLPKPFSLGNFLERLQLQELTHFYSPVTTIQKEFSVGKVSE